MIRPNANFTQPQKFEYSPSFFRKWHWQCAAKMKRIERKQCVVMGDVGKGSQEDLQNTRVLRLGSLQSARGEMIDNRGGYSQKLMTSFVFRRWLIRLALRFGQYIISEWNGWRQRRVAERGGGKNFIHVDGSFAACASKYGKLHIVSPFQLAELQFFGAGRRHNRRGSLIHTYIIHNI